MKPRILEMAAELIDEVEDILPFVDAEGKTELEEKLWNFEILLAGFKRAIEITEED